LIISGAFHENQGFTLGLTVIDQLSLYGVGTGIYRVITVEEAEQFKNSPYCNNKDTITIILELMGLE
jgi:hypothetical protein